MPNNINSHHVKVLRFYLKVVRVLGFQAKLNVHLFSHRVEDGVTVGKSTGRDNMRCCSYSDEMMMMFFDQSGGNNNAKGCHMLQHR